MSKKSFAVIGLGEFGSAVVAELIQNQMDVIAIDNNEDVVKKMSAILSTTYVADSSNQEALANLGIKEVDCAVVAFGGNKEASVLTTVVLKELGVKHIVVRVDDESYVHIMRKLGATEVITPQKAAGRALANRLGNEDYKDYHPLDENYSIVSILIKPGLNPIPLKELKLQNKYKVSIILYKRGSHSELPNDDYSILPDDIIYVVGIPKEITKFKEALNSCKL